MNNLRIAFLCGAGCEGAGQLGLTSGSSFKKDIVLSKDVKSIFEKLNSNKDFSVYDGAIVDARCSNILYQTLKEHKALINKLSPQNRKIFAVYDSYRIKTISDSDRQNAITAFKELYKGFLGKNDFVCEDERTCFFQNISLCSFADELFNYLRFPNIYRVETGKVMKLYYSAFYCMVNSLSDTAGNKSPKEEITNNESMFKNRKKIQSLIENYETSIIKKYAGKNNNLYYSIMRKYLRPDEAFIVTTNYTKFAELLTNFKVSYLHGRLDMFESVFSKNIDELKNFKDEGDVIFPFIFIPSGVKPIVCQWQIEQYAMAIKAFDEAEALVILGYAINSDDEHIKNFIKDRLKNNKTVYFFKYVDSDDDTAEFNENISKEFCNSDFFKVVYFSDKNRKYNSFEEELCNILRKH